MARPQYAKIGSGSHDEEELQVSHSKEERPSSRRGWVKALGYLMAAGALVFALSVAYDAGWDAAQVAPAATAGDGGEQQQKKQQQSSSMQRPSGGGSKEKPFWYTGPLLTPEQEAESAALQAQRDKTEDAIRATGGPVQEQVREQHRQWAEQVKKDAEEKAAKEAAEKAAAEEAERLKKEQEAAAAAGEAAKKEAEEKAKKEQEAAAAAAPAAPAAGEVDGNEVLEELKPLVEARRLAEAACKEMEMDFGEEDAKKLFGSMHFRNRDFIKRKIARAVLRKDQFVVSFAGTSVTAGHDNFFKEAYPLVFGRLLQPAFEAAGVNLVVRNHAMGNNPAIPAAFCVGAQLGEDTDVAVWEFGMMIGGPLQLPSIELWLRNALALPRRPALMFLDPGEGARKPDGEGKLPTEARPGEPGDWSGNFGAGDESLLQRYEGFGPHVQAMYEAVWSLDHLERYSFKALVADGKATSRPAAWHPGPGGHELRGKILAYNYLRLLDDALADAHAAREADLKAGKDVKAEQDKLVAAAEADSAAPLPAPLHCDPRSCADATQCALTYEPRAEGWGLQELLVTAPEAAKTAAPSMEAQDNGAWHVQLYGPDHEAVSFAKENDFGYLDMKYVLQGAKAAGPLTLKVTTTKPQRLFLCQPPGVWGRQPDDQANLNEGAAVAVDGKPVNLLPLDDPFYGEHKLEAKVCFATEQEVGNGEHELVLTPSEEGKYVALSAVVWY